MKTLEKLHQYLSSTTKEQFDDHWKEVEGVGVTGVTIKEFESKLFFKTNKMKTYVESLGETPFDWPQFVSRDPKSITKKEWENAEFLAFGWPTCACGNQCVIIPRNEIGTPMDDELTNLGNIFHKKIVNKDLKSAKEILTEIEKRAAELIKKILKEILKETK